MLVIRIRLVESLSRSALLNEPRNVFDGGSQSFMNNKKSFRTTCNGSSKQPDALQEFSEFINGSMGVPKKKESEYRTDMRWKYQPDTFAESLMDNSFPDWLPERLRQQAKDALRGFREDMALEVADNLLDAWTYGVRHYIGIAHVDRMLHSLYNKVFHCAKQEGIELPYHF